MYKSAVLHIKIDFFILSLSGLFLGFWEFKVLAVGEVYILQLLTYSGYFIGYFQYILDSISDYIWLQLGQKQTKKRIQYFQCGEFVMVSSLEKHNIWNILYIQPRALKYSTNKGANNHKTHMIKIQIHYS